MMITISLNPDSKEPMYQQIYEYIKKEILSGRLSHPDKLPSARSLASFLQVSRSTVDTAYDQLTAEGYVEPKEKRGYFVNPMTHIQNFTPVSLRPAPAPSHTDSSLSLEKKDGGVCYDFNPDSIDTTHFPYSVWKSIGKNELDNSDNFLSGSHFGEAALRESIAAYLHGSRGVQCTPEQIIVGAGLDHLLQMLCVLFQRDKIVAMEDPGYRSARKVLLASGYTVRDIPLENGTWNPSSLQDSDADICYVTPTHQFPLGTVMPVPVRQALLTWAMQESGRYIIEDDHDSEFRYVGRPIPALQSLDTGGKVIYIGTFSKAISPALRVGYMVLPPALLAQYKEICGSFSCPVSRINQAILTTFIRDGYFEKHLNRMRKHYKGKHDFMVSCIQEFFPEDTFCISGDNAGLYILLHYYGKEPAENIEKRAEKNAIKLYSLKKYYANLPAGFHPTYLLGFANIPEEHIRMGLRLLAKEVFLLP